MYKALGILVDTKFLRQTCPREASVKNRESKG